MGKQKVVIRVSMKDAKKQTKVLKIAVGLPGVTSAALEGVDKDRVVVVGDGIDSVKLTMLLRKQMGSAELVSVASYDEKKEKEKEKEKNKEYFGGGGGKNIVQEWPKQAYNNYSYSPYPYTYVTQEPNPSCAIM